MRRLGYNSSMIVDPAGYSRGMVMLWSEEEVDIQATSQSRWPIHAVVTAKFQRPWIMSTIYASTNKVCRKRVWDEVNGVGGIQDTERMVMGDLNTIGSGKEKVGGRKPTANQLEELRNVMNKNGLIDLGAHGPKWTWNIKRVGLDNIKERLNRLWIMLCGATGLLMPRYRIFLILVLIIGLF